MQSQYWWLICFYINILLFPMVFCSDEENYLDSNGYNSSKVLSRRKRFIIFPEGSSFQIVFCNTVPNLSPVGDIMLFGYTAALAYELPQDPYSPFNHKADPLHRRMDTKTLYFTDFDGKVLFKRPYKRNPIVNPAFAKRSVDSQTADKEFQYETGTFNLSISNKDIETLDTRNEIQESLRVNSNKVDKESRNRKPEFKIDRKQMHGARHKRDFLKIEHMDEKSVEFHRSSRASLYGKIEILLKALGANGQQCLLKALCQVGQTKEQSQGSFLQEILRVIFTLPKGKSYENSKHQLYDEAHFAKSSCDDLYPDCTEPEESNYV